MKKSLHPKVSARILEYFGVNIEVKQVVLLETWHVFKKNSIPYELNY